MVQTFGSFNVSAIGGGPLTKARLFRSRSLEGISSSEADYLVNGLAIQSIYNLRTAKEVASSSEPIIIGSKTLTLVPVSRQGRSDASKRLVAGVIGEYGAPEQRMCENYRRYVSDYEMIGTTLRTLTAERVPALVHCQNGKDRTGIVSALILKISGWDDDDIMQDYLSYNSLNLGFIQEDRAALCAGMTSYEHDILDSFLEARPAYLAAFFDEIKNGFTSFDAYVQNYLRMSNHQREALAAFFHTSPKLSIDRN